MFFLSFNSKEVLLGSLERVQFFQQLTIVSLLPLTTESDSYCNSTPARLLLQPLVCSQTLITQPSVTATTSFFRGGHSVYRFQQLVFKKLGSRVPNNSGKMLGSRMLFILPDQVPTTQLKKCILQIGVLGSEFFFHSH